MYISYCLRIRKLVDKDFSDVTFKMTHDSNFENLPAQGIKLCS